MYFLFFLTRFEDARDESPGTQGFTKFGLGREGIIGVTQRKIIQESFKSNSTEGYVSMTSARKMADVRRVYTEYCTGVIVHSSINLCSVDASIRVPNGVLVAFSIGPSARGGGFLSILLVSPSPVPHS